MYKKNLKEAIRRNMLFIERKLMNGILIKINLKKNPYVGDEEKDPTWKDRQCLLMTDKEWIIDNCHKQMSVYSNIDDDTIPYAYPTMHVGESFYSAMLGGNIKFVGTGSHTCSGAEPIITSKKDLDKLKIDEDNYWVKVFKETATYFAEKARGEFCLNYIITIDALNLAVELLGTSIAYLKIYEDEQLIKKIMEFGIKYNLWFYRLQKKIFECNNRMALADNAFYDIYDRTWYSIDAYNLCHEDVYQNLGFSYQQKLIESIGGGMMHTHGTGIFRLLPKIAKHNNLSMIQVGRDTREGNIGIDKFQWFRSVTGDMPLMIEVTKKELLEGIKGKLLPGGVCYSCEAESVDEANNLVCIAKTYKAPPIGGI